MSRMNRRSSPTPRWKTSSCSYGPRTLETSQLMVHRDSFKRTGPSDFLPDNHRQRRPPVPSDRLGFPTDVARQRSSFQTASSSPVRNSRSEQRLNLSSKNHKSFEAGSLSRTYYKHLRDNIARPASAQPKFQAFLKNNKTKLYIAGVKRSPDRKDFLDFPPAKQQKRNMEERDEVPYQSTSSQFNSSNVLWCKPPCRQRSKSREGKLDSVQHGSHIGKQCQDRDSRLKQRRANVNLKTSCQDYDEQISGLKNRRGQHPNSWRQFPSNKLSGNLEEGSPWAGAQHNAPRLQRKSGEDVMHHLEQRNSSESLNRKTVRHSTPEDRSPRRRYNQRRRYETSSTLTHRYQENNERLQSQKSATINNRFLQDGHRSQGTSFSSEGDSCHQTKARNLQKKHGSYERESRDKLHQESINLACSKRSSSVESFSQVDRSSLDIVAQEKSGSLSLSSVSRRSRSLEKHTGCTPSDRSVEGGESMNWPCSGSDVKAKVLKFNPDYVVIIRRTNEGARPLCTREEFSGILVPLVDNDEQLRVAAQKCNGSDKNTQSLMVPVDLKQEVRSPSSEFSPAGKECSIKSTQEMHKLAEKAGKTTNAKPATATFHTPSITVANTSSKLTKAVADERFVRTRTDSFRDQRGQEQTDRSSKSAEEVASLSSKKSTFDLRQRIAERRQMRTGRTTSARIVRPWPHRWRSLPQMGFWNLGAGSRAVERRHYFAPWKTETRRSVMLK